MGMFLEKKNVDFNSWIRVINHQHADFTLSVWKANLCKLCQYLIFFFISFYTFVRTSFPPLPRKVLLHPLLVTSLLLVYCQRF